MKQISEGLLNRLKRETLTLCRCWKLNRKDGLIIGITDHDRVIMVGDTEYSPGASLDRGQFARSLDLKPTYAGTGGVLASDLITESDLRAGLWADCRIEVFIVDWQMPELGGIDLWSGFFSEIRINDQGQFEADLVSLKAELERPVGRRLERRCDAVLGDARCGAEPLGRTCDQRFETCETLFQNTHNFRGFPHLPGTDFVLSGPAAGLNDGGKR